MNAPRCRLLSKLSALSALLGAVAGGCGGAPPADLGAPGGRLRPCPPTPNCVSSQADPADSAHYLPPMPFAGPADGARARLLALIEELPRTRVERAEPRYLHATFRSALFRFIDDVELVIDDSAGVVHFRSASRVGRGDLGVNRRRMEEIRRRFAVPLASPREPVERRPGRPLRG